MNRYFVYLFALVFALLESCSPKQMSKDEAERSLKVLNSDLVSFGQGINDATETQILHFLMEKKAVPFPFYANSNRFVSVKEFDLEVLKGLYEWNETVENFELVGKAEQVELLINTADFQETQLNITAFSTQIVSSGEPFPLTCNMEILQRGKRIWSLRWLATISRELPEQIELLVEASDYKVTGALQRTTNGEKGKLLIDFDFQYSLKTLLDFHWDCDIAYSRQGYYFEYLKLDNILFNHRLSGYVDYKNVNPTAEDYPADFNSNANLLLIEKHKGEVGKVVLASTENDELHDFHIMFSNNSKNLLSEYIPMLGKLLNLKY